jgi:hypothetical protein
MGHQNVLDLLRKLPFQPFRIYATDGRTYDVRHPDQAVVLRSRVILPLASDPDEYADRTEHLALVEILRAEELATDSTSKSTATG